MKKKILYGIAIVMASVFVAAGIYAGTTVPDVVEMKNPGYKKHTKGIVTFTHKKHTDDYGIACGACHHDADGKPLTIKAGDDVKGCGECHSTFGKVSKKDKKMKKAEKIKKYYEQAMHANCIDCHKKEKKGPKKCSECHPKKKK